MCLNATLYVRQNSLRKKTHMKALRKRFRAEHRRIQICSRRGLNQNAHVPLKNCLHIIFRTLRKCERRQQKIDAEALKVRLKPNHISELRCANIVIQKCFGKKFLIY